MVKKIWCIFLTLCLLAGVAPPWVHAAVVASGTCGDNVTWELDDAGTLTIFGNGAMVDYIYNNSSSSAPWYDSRNNITATVIENGVTSIGNYAFYGCTAMTSVSIPNSVTSIGISAFSGCSGLTNVTIPNSVTSIGNCAFYGCSGLTNVTIPNSVTSIEYSAFYGCSGLTNVTIPNSVTSIEGGAFEGCSGLTNVTIPNSVTSIGSSAFYDCSKLTDVNYSGTIAQWNAILLLPVNDYLDNVTIHCTDGVLNGNTEQESNITITLDQSSALLEPDGRITLTATVTPAANVTWETDKTGIIVQDSTNSDGNTITYRGLKAGEVNVRACVGERQSEPCKITVSGVAFVTSTVTVPVGGSVDMTVTTYGESKNVPVSSWNWVSADSNIAIVTPTSSGFTVRGVQPGQTTLNVTIGVYKATCLVNVADTAITTIGLSESTITMAPGTSSRLRANTTADSDDIQWTVSNPEIVTIAERSGYTVVLASGSIGVTTVTAQLGSGASASCTVIVDSRQSEPTPSPSPDEGKETHTVTFDENGGGGFMNAVTVSGGTYTLPENGFSAPYGMRFQAWGVGDMEYPPNVTIAISGDLTVMALWEPDPTPLAQGYCGANGTNLSWTLSRDWHLTVSGTGDMQSYDDSTRAPWYGYHTNISSATLENGVTSIGSAAFTYCAALDEVTLPDTLVSIGDNAFFNCAALEEVEFPGGLAALGNSAFYGCEALTGIELPPRITDIGNYTFAHCTELETASLPAGLTRVGLYAFYDCGSLRSVAVPSGVTTLDIGAFKDCGALRTVSFPAGLTAINASVFEGCGSLYNQSYAGTVSQFEQIAMTLGAGNDELKEHVVHCSDGDYDWTPPDPYRILDNLQDMDEFQDQIWHLAGPLSEFERFTIDERQLQRSSELLRNGSDYVASEGSTKLTIPAESFRTFGEGSHTAAAEFDNAATGTETRKQMYTVFPKPGTAKISLREMLGVTGVEKVSYSGRFQSDPVLGDGLYRFVLISGEIPPGLTLEEGGYFTGVARTAGSYHFEVGLQVKRGNDWPSGYEDTAQMDITIEPGTREQIKVVSDPGYEIVKPVSDQITESTETVIEPENFTLISNGPYEEFKDLYIDAELKIRDVDYEVMPYNGNDTPTLMVGSAATQTYIVGKNLSISAGTHTLSLEFEHKDNLDNKKIHKAAQTFSVKKRGSGGDNDYSSGGISGGGGGGGGSATPHYTITKKKAANGAITLSKSNAASGTTVTITPKPNKGYQVDKVSVTASNKKDVPVSVSKGVYSFKMPSRRVTVSATFKPVSGTTPTSATASVAPTEHGAVKLSSASPLPGVSVTVHTTPEPGYQVMGVTVSAPGKGGIKVENVGDNVFKFVMPSGGVTVTAAFTPKRLAFFTDIQGPDWFFSDAEWAYNRGILRGVTEQIWQPQKEISGVTAIVTLERLDGVNLAPYYNGANDGLDNTAWYVAAARWARTNGILPMNWAITDELPLTRGEYAILLYNFARYRGLNVSASDSMRFSDAALLSEAEYNAFRFLQGVGVFQGYEDGAVRPQTRLSRAQLSALLHRFSEYIISAERSYT